ncbi:hypothetical protein [Methylovulum miyakonense]|uniref:hypothetical protein n=1 Tax=Methylovulum miyakonense TaxID=645578 RepID=UPI0003632F48|nr:hypothetical protein [Methylovulum miyakonense]
MKTSKSLFENTPSSKLWQDRDDKADVETFVSLLKKPPDVDMTDEEIDELFKRDKDMGRDIDLEDK